MFRLIYCILYNIILYSTSSMYFSIKLIKFEIWIQYFEENALKVSTRILLDRLFQISSRQILELVRDDLEIDLTP